MGPFHRNALMPPPDDDSFYGHLRVITPDEASAPRGRVIDPGEVRRQTYILREYPLEQTETGELYGVAAQPPELPPWRTETIPEPPEWDEARVRGMARDYLQANPMETLRFGSDYLKKFLPSTPSQPQTFELPPQFGSPAPMNRLLPQRPRR